MNDLNKEFDGVKQADNPLPVWWKWFFVLCIVFAILYPIYYHNFSTWGMEQSFRLEVEEHEKKYPASAGIVSQDGSNPLRDDAVAIEEGQKTFKMICAACHGPEGKGLVGPNLIDNEWIHGAVKTELTDEEAFNLAMKGIPVEKTTLKRGPMPPHEVTLGSEKVYQVLAWLAKQNPTLVKLKAQKPK